MKKQAATTPAQRAVRMLTDLQREILRLAKDREIDLALAEYIISEIDDSCSYLDDQREPLADLMNEV